MDFPLRAALTLGITSSAIVSGINLHFAGISMPSLLNTPAVASLPAGILLNQWQQHYDLGKTTALPFILLSVVGFGYSAVTSRGNRQPRTPSWRLLAGAAMCLVAVPLLTKLFMEGPFGDINLVLSRLNTNINARTPLTFSIEETTSVRSLCEQWGLMCGIRAMFPLLGAVLGVWSIL